MSALRHQTDQPPDPRPVDAAKITRGHSCVVCQQRKVRCDGQRPCSRCVKANVDCISKPPTTPRRRKVKPPHSKGQVLSRLSRCEELLEKKGLDTDGSIASPESSKQGVIQHNTTWTKPSRGIHNDGALIVEEGRERYIEDTMWGRLTGELQSTEAASLPSTAAKAIPSPSPVFQAENFIFGRPVVESLTSRHPDPVKIFTLWQLCLEDVNVLARVLHAPTVQNLVLRATRDLSQIEPNLEALLFSIYLSAVSSMQDDECLKIMGESSIILKERYTYAAQQALINAGLLKTPDVMVMQAFTLFLLSIRPYTDAHTMWLMTGLAIRCSRTLGLHRERALSGLPIFEAEIRRRLWWQLLLLDSRSAKLVGVSSETDSWDTRRPLNVNDSDLHPNMKEPPIEHPGVTEMLFPSVRYEIGEFVHNHKDTIQAHLSMSEKNAAVEQLMDHLQQKYVKYCDPSIPLHSLAVHLIRSAVCRIKLSTYRQYQHPEQIASLPQQEKDMLFSICLEMLEIHNRTRSAKSIQKYIWHLKVFYPIEALTFMLSELAYRKPDQPIAGDLVDHAWKHVLRAYELHPEWANDRSNALYVAQGNLAVKAWEKRPPSSVVWQNDSVPPTSPRPPTPPLISTLRSHRTAKHAPSTPPTSSLPSTSSSAIPTTTTMFNPPPSTHPSHPSPHDPTTPYTQQPQPQPQPLLDLSSSTTSSSTSGTHLDLTHFLPSTFQTDILSQSFLPEYMLTSDERGAPDWEYWQYLLEGRDFTTL